MKAVVMGAAAAAAILLSTPAAAGPIDVNALIAAAKNLRGSPTLQKDLRELARTTAASVAASGDAKAAVQDAKAQIDAIRQNPADAKAAVDAVRGIVADVKANPAQARQIGQTVQELVQAVRQARGNR